MEALKSFSLGQNSLIMKLKSIHLLILSTLCWGPSFLFIKIALVELSPIMLSILRIGLGALILNLVLIMRRDYPTRDIRFWKDSAVAGFFSVALPFLLINWGQQFIDSSLGALLNGTTPFFTVLFSLVLLRNEPVSENKIRGIVLGFIGLLILVFPNLREGMSAGVLGIGAVVLASASYGLGWVWVRKRLIEVPSFKAPAAQLLIGTLYLLPIGFFTDSGVNPSEISLLTISSVLFLGTFGTAVAFIFYFKLIEKAGASYASMVTFLVPVIGVFLGVLILQETITVWILSGALLILYGIYIGSRKPMKPCCPEASIDIRSFSKIR